MSCGSRRQRPPRPTVSVHVRPKCRGHRGIASVPGLGRAAAAATAAAAAASLGSQAGSLAHPCPAVLEFPAPKAAGAADKAGSSGSDGSPIKTSGLHRTPLSGGVQNATLRCDLPSPAVAVRNLVEQAQYAHLCTIMCGMHHRRAGYPFGSLVDFAADGAGHPIFRCAGCRLRERVRPPRSAAAGSGA